MDLTPAFFDRWREHRELGWMDRVRDVFDRAAFYDDWLDEARTRVRARETVATLRLAGVEVDEETVKAIVDRGETAAFDAGQVADVQAYAEGYGTAMAAAEQQTPVTPALLDDVHASLLGILPRVDAGAPSPAVSALCDWLATPPPELHPVVVASVAHVELLRLRLWPDGNARMARLVLLLLLTRGGYGYRGLLAPSTHWSDPRQLPAAPAEELSPKEAETQPAVEHIVRAVANALRETVTWVRAEEGSGSIAEMLFAFPLQP